MRRVVSNLLMILPFAAGLVSCVGDVVEIKGQFIGTADSMVYLESFSSLSQGSIIDSAAIDSKGEFRLRFKSEEDEISIYNLICDHSRIPLLLEGGDRVTIKSIGDIVNSYRVEGSHESEQLRLFYQPYLTDIIELNKIASRYSSPRSSEQRKGELAEEYAELYQNIRRRQIEYIVENRNSLASVYAISQRVAGDTYIFNAQSDAIYYRTLIESLEESYPNTKYLNVLQGKLNELELINRISSDITTITLPEIELPDMYGTQHLLTESLGDSVTLLDFWTPEHSGSNISNSELKEIYAKYNEKGFEVFQVALDPMKSRWVAAIQEQRLPWICVNDLNGASSIALRLYNVTSLPANYLIDSEGKIIARNVDLDTLEGLIERSIK